LQKVNVHGVLASVSQHEGNNAPAVRSLVLDEESQGQVTGSGVPVVVKFLKFQRCPEIRNCPEILVIW